MLPIGIGIGREDVQVARQLLVPLCDCVHLIFLEDGCHEHTCIVELAYAPSKLLFHIVSEHMEKIRSARLLNIRSVEPFFEGRTVGRPIETVQKSIFTFIVADSSELPRIFRHHSLVKHTVQMDNV